MRLLHQQFVQIVQMYVERSNMTSSLISLPFLAVVLGVIYIASRAVYNVFFHPLRKFPGPLINKITSVVSGYYQLRGNLIYHLRDLHEKHGVVVRVGPNELSYIDEKAWADIYGHRTLAGTGDLPKDLRNVRFESKKVPHIINADDEDHRRFRRIQAPLFSEKAISAQESFMTDFVNLLISQLRARAGGAVNIVDWYTFTTFDVLGDLAFGKSFGCLESGRLDTWIENTNLLFKDASNWSASYKFPWPLNKLIYSLTPKKEKNSLNERIILRNQVVHQRIERDSSQEKLDFMSQMMKYNDEKGMTIPEIESNSGVLIIAGSETTATLLSGLTYLLLTNREHLEKLTKLIRTTFKSPKDIKALALYQLEYLSAIIDESFRLYPPAAGPLLRMAKKGGSVICGEFIPEYTTVGIPQFVAYRSPRNWADPEKFVPERWYKDDRCPERYRNDRRKVFQPFSYGPRNCVGKNMSTTEMRLVIAHILWNFDMELEPDSLDWMNQKAYALWEKGPMNVKFHVRQD